MKPLKQVFEEVQDSDLEDNNADCSPEKQSLCFPADWTTGQILMLDLHLEKTICRYFLRLFFYCMPTVLHSQLQTRRKWDTTTHGALWMWSCYPRQIFLYLSHAILRPGKDAQNWGAAEVGFMPFCTTKIWAAETGFSGSLHELKICPSCPAEDENLPHARGIQAAPGCWNTSCRNRRPGLSL